MSATQTNGLRASLAVAADAGVSAQAWAYGYDSMARLRALSSPAGAFSQSYWLDKPTRLVGGIGLPTGGYRTNNYTLLGLLTVTALKSSAGATLDAYSYTRDSGGPPVRRLSRDALGSTVDYLYDGALQLTNAAGKEGGGTARKHEQFGYVYDAAGNLIDQQVGTHAQQFSVNSLNQITAVSRIDSPYRPGLGFLVAGWVTTNATNVSVNTAPADLYVDGTWAKDGLTVTNGPNTFTATARDAIGRTASQTTTYQDASASYQYDLNGNLLSDGRRHFTYDDENQLTTVVVTNVTKSEFGYDGKLRRRVRKESTWTGLWQQTLEVHYLYDGNLAVQERHYDGAVPTSYPQRVVTYTRGTDLSGSREGAGGIGGLLARSELSALDARLSTAFYHSDMVGNVTALVDTNEQVVARYLYEPFGRVIAMSGPLAEANTYRFSSKEAHDSSGLVYYLYRYYEPQLQRWPNRDPINEPGFKLLIQSQNPFNLDEEKNLYGFARNNPVVFYDADGRVVPIVIVGGVAIGAAEAAAAAFGLSLAACLASPPCAQAVRDAIAEAMKEICRARPYRASQKCQKARETPEACYYICPTGRIKTIKIIKEYPNSPCPKEI